MILDLSFFSLIYLFLVPLIIYHLRYRYQKNNIKYYLTPQFAAIDMKNTNNVQTPSDIFGSRFRFQSINSPFLSPLHIVPSPYNQNDPFNGQHEGIPSFQLEQRESHPSQKNQSNQQDQEVHSNADDFSHTFEELIIPLDENNMLEIVLKYVGKENQKIYEELAKRVQGGEIYRRLFDYLWEKFAKLKKTKEEMVKYCIRKSFKFITNRMRAENKADYQNMENNEVVSEYFVKNSGDDETISMPFQRSSIEKTMNTNFLKKIFKCKKYNEDYKQFLKQFPQELQNDNSKKIKSMNETIKKVVKNRCFKTLDDYKRLPWTQQILQRLQQFAQKLVEHSPFASQAEKKMIEKQNSCQDQFEIIKSSQMSQPSINNHLLEPSSSDYGNKS